MSYWNNGRFAARREQRKLPASGLSALTALGVGAGLMYLLDPQRGRRRRATIYDKATRLTHVADRAVRKAARDLNHRAYGLWAETSQVFRCDEATDEVLTARVRSQLGRLSAHPHAIEVMAEQGRVRLTGEVLAAEADELVRGVAQVRGVREVADQLTRHADAAGVASLQGGPQRTHGQINWPPAERLLAGAAGAALLGYCLKRRDLAGAALGTLGFGLFLRGTTNQRLGNLLGLGQGGEMIEVQKTMQINAPVTQVFDFWTDYRNFPHFMSNIRAVKPIGDRRSHWTVAGPLGLPVEWVAEVTDFERNKLLSWRTVRGSAVHSEGTIHFEHSNGGTRIQIRLRYQPLGGVLGHAAAKLFGADPKSEMDADLVRLKTLLETGHVARDAAQPLAGPEAALVRPHAA